MNTKDGYAIDNFVILEQDGEPITSQSRVNSIKSQSNRWSMNPLKSAG